MKIDINICKYKNICIIRMLLHLKSHAMRQSIQNRLTARNNRRIQIIVVLAVVLSLFLAEFHQEYNDYQVSVLNGNR